MGTNVWGRSAGRLRAPVRRTPKSAWITRDSAFPAIIDKRTFEKAQKVLDSWHWSDQRLLDELRKLWQREGKLSIKMLYRRKRSPCYTTFVAHFGSFSAALRLIGYKGPDDRSKLYKKIVSVKRIHNQIVTKIAAGFPRRLKVIRKISGKLELLLDGRHRVTVQLAPPHVTSFRKTSRSVKPDPDERNIPTVCCLITADYKKVIAVYAGPGFPPRQHKFVLKPGRPWFDQLVIVRSSRSLCEVLSGVIDLRRIHAAQNFADRRDDSTER